MASASSSETNATVVGTSAAPVEDHATRGGGGGGGAEAAAAAEAALSTDHQSRANGRTVQRPTLYTTVLAQECKMNWAEACYFSLQFSTTLNDFDKKAMSAYAFATAQDHMDTLEDFADSFEGGGSGDAGRRLCCRPKAAAAVPTSR